MQKRLSRAQEKVLQKLGKADETRDTAFEEGVANFNKQMAEGTKLQKDLRAYLAAVKTMHDASKRLQDCLADMYEPEWFGKEEVDTIAEETDILWSDYHDKLADNSMIAMDNYLAQFPDIKARIAKRDRKMTDYDSARHHFGSLQKGKKQDQAKIAKPMSLVEKAAPGWAQGILSAHQIAQTNLTRNQAEEELGRAQKVFEEINVDLQDELPQLWNSRVGFYVNTFQSMAGYQQRFHKDMGKIFLVSYLLSLILQFLLLTHGPFMPCGFLSSNRRSHSKFSVLLHPRAPWPPLYLPYCLAPFPPQPEPEHPPAVEEPQQNDDKGSQETKAGWEEEESAANQGGWGDDETGAAPSWDTEGTQASQACWDQDVTQTGHSQGGWGDNGAQVGEEAADAASDGQYILNQVAISLCVMSKKIIIQVKAMHDYAATDGDELEMKAGDVVLVLAWENPDEQDDGWLMGVKESHWLENKDLLAKGVFPENFTQKL
uniref:Myc box-dependent-interacting protein 1 n=1 Tax=Oncorhynchus mykiss TaxID=8022 RepID=A0A8C7Q4V0_ONCMY